MVNQYIKERTNGIIAKVTSDDKLELMIYIAGKDTAWVEFDAAQLDVLIETLANKRDELHKKIRKKIGLT